MAPVLRPPPPLLGSSDAVLLLLLLLVLVEVELGLVPSGSRNSSLFFSTEESLAGISLLLEQPSLLQAFWEQQPMNGGLTNLHAYQMVLPRSSSQS